MNIRHIAGTAVLVIAFAFAFHVIQQPHVEAQSSPQASVAQQSGVAVEYAMLTVSDDAESVTWLIGGNDRVRTETIKQAYRRLGGTGRGSFSDLLNQIGAGGWNLVQKDGSVWIFTRRAM